ncbi:MAG: glyceraldehyde 3-phosphate dehydrogenase NAD-binding domain-containing protein [Candidatus Krumholzibacteriia bacterium]|nr:type I glyceraldehyde-3-phosphate dehydrogenase [bacterium]MCB9513502.1 type I glyceraldehyde-3-phosphate dehydrogenase [Candidatus Latescibacterota bacterium]MCB9516215.1 type I glyceraldehyde-3-phosphate dehydrogenase [Candidatus Latescibacterota bacterium]
MSLRVGIMGFGRIGRNLFRQAVEREDFEIVAISDLGTPEAMAYLLNFDTIYGRFPEEVTLDGKYLAAGRQRARLLKGVAPEDMPWDAYNVDVVVDSTGVYRKRSQLEGHLRSGAHRVILTTPALDSIDRTVVHGVNEQSLRPEDRIVSCASSTTHALALMLKVLDEAFGVERAMMTTVHAYSSDQKLSDTITPNLRRSRSAAENLIPNWTWSPGVVEKMMPHLKGKIDGIAVNVPVPNGSNLDLSAQLRGAPDRDAVNAALRDAAGGALNRYLEYATEPIVSSDVIGNDHSAVFDSLATLALPGGLVKTITWYDNGWGYAARIIDTALTLGAFAVEEVQR